MRAAPEQAPPAESEPAPQYESIREAAERLRVSESTIRNYARAGGLGGGGSPAGQSPTAPMRMGDPSG